MIFDKYLNDTYLDILYSNYNLDYLKSIDENNFIEIYNLLKNKGFYFIYDIIIIKNNVAILSIFFFSFIRTIITNGNDTSNIYIELFLESNINTPIIIKKM